MQNSPSLVRAFAATLDRHGDWPYLTFLESGDWDGPRQARSAEEILAGARRVAGLLQARGLAGQAALLLYPPGVAFLEAFLGCTLANVVAVPVWPPDPARLARTLPRLSSIAADADARAVLTTGEISQFAVAFADFAPALAALPWLATDGAHAHDFHDAGHGDVAFLQYTSGSTGQPKGVVVTHANLLANIRTIQTAYGVGPGDSLVTWLPQYHDMGLIGGLLVPAMVAGSVWMMSPVDFLRRPFRWLDAVHRSRASVTGAPDFAWALAARKVTEREAAGIDLSCLRVAFSGAEPIRAETLEAFEHRFAPSKFPRRAWLPVYGLAEATLFVSGGPRGVDPAERAIDPARLEAGEAAPGDRRIVACGEPGLSVDIRVVDGDGVALPDDRVGEIVVRGPAVAKGYWRDPVRTEQAFGLRIPGEEGTWLRTGDLGFLSGGALYVTGRAKDLLIVRGRNLYPQDLESTAEAAHPAVRGGCVVAFGDVREGEERVGIAAEIDPKNAVEGPRAVADAIRAALAEHHDLAVDPILLVEPRGLPKTSSGKLQRAATREAWKDGSLPILHAVHAEPAAPKASVARDPLLARLVRQVAAWTGRSESEVDADAPLLSLGLDSLRLVELAQVAEQLSGARVEMAAVYNHPTLARLAAHVGTLSGGTLPSEEPVGPAPVARPTAPDGTPRTEGPLYPGMDDTLARLDGRSTAYQFDLEADLRWEDADLPGAFVPDAVVRGLGLDVSRLADPDVRALCQWALAMAVCIVFERLEAGVVAFLRGAVAPACPSRSLDLFVDEEDKHIAMFRRFRATLERSRPGDVAAFTEAFAPALEILGRMDVDPVAATLANNPALTEADAHYLAWLHATFFEGYTVWIHDALAASDVAVQPLWRRVHALHRQEEIQHLVSDHAYLRHLAVPPARRASLSAAFCAVLLRDFEHLFGVDAVARLVRARTGVDPRQDDPLRTPRAVQAVLAIPALASLRREAPFAGRALSLPPERLVPEAFAAATAEEIDASAAAREQAALEPVAIVGIGCRYPGGARDPESLFEQLVAGKDAIAEIPPSRWDIGAWYDPDPDATGKMITRWGGMVDGVEDFDPLFFGIAPREASSMDPQQRVLLEVAWEALEDAAIPPARLAGTKTGVWVGISSWDYSLRNVTEPIGPWSMTGTALSIASGRLSYLLDLRGPSLCVDTACSSSLVALHLAVRSLRSGESDAALVGGVQLVLSPKSTIGFSRLRAMSPTGHCRTFDADADGYVRSDGCGVLVLKRLSDAERDGDRIHAVILGTAVNQDGRSSGLTAPSGAAQQAVMRAALDDAGVRADALGYLEAHGTGTPLGDPIELSAIGEVAKGRAAPLWVGSVKSAIGHSEAASGVAGVIKAALAAREGLIPPNLNFSRPNPHVDWDALPVRVPTAPVPWNDTRRVAGVNSFGFGGTNAHVVLASPPELETAPARSTGLRFLPLSAPDDAQLAASAGRLADWLDTHPDASLDDVAHTLAVGRTVFGRRAAIPAPDRDTALAGLRAAAGGTPPVGPLDVDAPTLGMLFTGQGAQYPGMGLGLWAAHDGFRARIEEAAALLGPRLGRPLRDLLADPEAIHQTVHTQPALVALEVALAEVWRSVGVSPAVLLGHSVGEIAAACVAGVFDLAGALTLVEARARLMQSLPRDGAMVALGTNETIVTECLAPDDELVAIAAVNGARQVVISGDERAVARVVTRVNARVGADVARRLEVSHAFHSPKMDPILDAFEDAIRRVPMSRPKLPLVSNVSGALAGAEVARPGYWSMHVRAPVRFADGLQTALRRGITGFVEVGPHPTLLALAGEAKAGLLLLPSLRKAVEDGAVLTRSVATAWAAGAPVSLGDVLPGRRIGLPTWPFARQRHWLTTAPEGGVTGEATKHPLLGRKLDLAGPVVYEVTLSAQTHPVLAQHRVEGVPVVPAAAWAELARAAGDGRAVESLEIHDALRWPDPVRVQTCVDGDTVRMSARASDGWRAHATARLATAPLTRRRVDLDVPVGEPVAADYAAFEAAGLGYGPAFQGLVSVARGAGVARAEIRLSDEVRRERGFGLHPAVLDAAFQAAGALLDDVALALPVGVDRFVLHEAPAEAVVAIVRATGVEDAVRRFDIDLCEPDGRLLAEIAGLKLRVVRGARARPNPVALATSWEPLAAPPAASAASRVVLGEGTAAEALRAALGAGDDASGRVDELWVPLAGLDLDAGVARLLAASRVDAARTYVVCAGAFLLPGDRAPEPATMAAQRGLWGFARSMSLERPGRVRLVDAGPGETGAAEAGARDAEDQVAWRDGRRFGARLAPVEGALLPPTGDWQLRIPTRGSVDGLTVAGADAGEPGPGQVRIAVEAAGLNFRDVLNVLGMYPGDPGPLGGECAGRVEAVGEGVTGLSIGDRVMAIAPGTFARSVVTDARLVVPRPAGWSAEQAATLPIAFATAWYGLYDLAGLRAGQTLLVHAAAGGVGLAAIQLARRVEARVLGTASGPKQALVLEAGAAAVASSREPGFSAVFGEPAHAVLNSLVGPFIPESLRMLVPGGHFLEMGKTELWTPEQVAAVAPEARYQPFDLAALPVDLLARLLRDVASAAAQGEIRPLPVRTWPIVRAAEAFRFMAAGRHTGKIVLTNPGTRASGTWIVTGGTGAVGGALALALADAGAERLVLVARQGRAPEKLVDGLRARGAAVEVVAADVADPAGVATIAAVAGPVEGIVHAAGVVDDALVPDLDVGRVRAVCRPKVEGAARLVARWPNAAFVATSSVAAAMGSPGQAAYSAANGALDGLCTAMAAAGRTAVSVQYGPWAGAGMAAGTAARHAAQGLIALEPSAGAHWLGLALDLGESVVCAAPLDRRRLASRLAGRVPPLLARLGLDAGPAELDLAAELAKLPREGRRARLLAHLQQAVARVLGAPLGAVDPRRPLRDLGLDSLMAVDLQAGLGQALRTELPRTLLMDFPTLAALAEHLAGEPDDALAVATPETRAPAPVAPIASDEAGDVSSAVAAELAALQALL